MNLLKGKVCLITGGTSGIGKEVTREMLRLGAEVVCIARDMSKAEAVRKEFEKIGKISFLKCDLASFESIRSFLGEFTKKFNKLDILINNAGVGIVDRQESSDFHEMHMAVNYFAPYTMIISLLPLMMNSDKPKVINIVSTMHRQAKIDFNDFELKNNYEHYRAYSNSKFALLAFTLFISKIDKFKKISFFAIHPGVVNTQLTKSMMKKSSIISKIFFPLTMDSEKKAAEAIVQLAVNESFNNKTGLYFEKKNIVEPRNDVCDQSIQSKIYKLASEATLLTLE